MIFKYHRIKKEDMRSRAWKLKCFAFLNGEQKELDAGIENIEEVLDVT